MRMIRLLALIAAFALTSCFAYKVVPENSSRPFASDAELVVSRIKPENYPYPEGLHCFEPMLYLLTVGIIPAHCVERYSVSATAPGDGGELPPVKVKVTVVGGWIALLLIPLPNWRYAPIPEPGPALEKAIKRSVTESR